ncbi:thymidine kinase [Pleionea sediminis]|uniref:thymidine kinase n=1 Tax=Pleionea sediminis TaxID=2569479 RepID=UPI001184A6FE
MAQLYFYYSSMNAGKSTYLLQSSFNYRERGMTTAIYSPEIDNRYGKNLVASRTGLSEEAYPFNQAFSFLNHLKGLSHQVDCVLVDEAQFLSRKQVYELTEIVDNLNIPVLTFGIRTDFKADTFEGSEALLAWADKLIELKTICHCGKKANFIAKVDASGKPVTQGAQIEIGGNERYISLCRKHYKELTSFKLELGDKEVLKNIPSDNSDYPTNEKQNVECVD